MNIRDFQGPSKKVFMTEDEVMGALEEMVKNIGLDTQPSYIKDSQEASHLISFIERHTAYLKGHPKVNPEHYLANLRTMIKDRKEQG